MACFAKEFAYASFSSALLAQAKLEIGGNQEYLD